jgi:hypothetical protein
MFDETSRLLGRAAMRSLSDLVYKTLLANTGSFFSGGNSNYDAGVGTALSITSLEAGIARMMAQRDTEKRDLDIRAKTLLVPPELQVSAKQLLMSEFIQRATMFQQAMPSKIQLGWKLSRDCLTAIASQEQVPRHGICLQAHPIRQSSLPSFKASKCPQSSFLDSIVT